MIRHYRRSQSGFSLLEVLLALGLSVIVIGAVALAVQLHLVVLSRQQAEIESKQVARSVLLMITNDVRAAIQYRAQDFSSLENLAVSEAMLMGIAAATSDDDEGGAGDLGAGDIGAGGDPGGDPAAADPDEEPMDPEDCVSCRPTFIGTSTAISVDASRLPRVDEFVPLVASLNNLVHTPSDVKTIAYFVDGSAPAQKQTRFDIRSDAAPGGLYRRQIDRAVAAYRGETGTVAVDQYAKLVAPEVAEISIRYYDGEQWVDKWDSEEMGGFPPAVEVVVVIDPARTRDGSSYSYSGFDPNTMQTHRAVIHLPAAELEQQ